MKNVIISFFQFIGGVILFFIAYGLILPLTLINFIYVLIKKCDYKGYFRSTAVNIDKFGNKEFRSLFNACLITDKGYKFGDIRETMSSVLGKNQRDNTLTKIGRGLCFILDTIDKNHCIKSIVEF